MMTKDEAREWVFQQKHGMGQAILDAGTTLVIRSLKQSPWFLSAKKIGAFAPVPDQPDVSLVMSDPDRTFYIPAYDEEQGCYRMAKMGETFKHSRLCKFEPVAPEFADADELDLILVPGTAFDGAGHRIGPVEDVYESLLPQYNALKVGVAFDCQYLKDFPSDAGDPAVDILLTESRNMDFRA